MLLHDWSAFAELAKAFAEGPVCLRVGGLNGAARALVVAELHRTHPQPVLVVVATLLSVPPVPEFILPLFPAFALLGLVGLVGDRRVPDAVLT